MHDSLKLKAELSRFQKDINDNIVKAHKPRGSVDPKNIQITTDQLVDVDKTYTLMSERLQEMKENGKWNKTSVQEQS